MQKVGEPPLQGGEPPAQLDLNTLGLPPAQLHEAAKEWIALIEDMAALRATEFRTEEPHEPTQSDRRLGQALTRILGSLDVEESRWRTEAAGLESQWHMDAEAMFARWREEDAASLQMRQRQASEEAQQHEARLGALTPLAVQGWSALVERTRLDRVGASRIAVMIEAERAATSAAAGTHRAPMAPVMLGASQLRRFLDRLTEADASVLADEVMREAICAELARAVRGHPVSSDWSSAASGGGGGGGGGGSGGGGGGGSSVAAGGASAASGAGSLTLSGTEGSADGEHAGGAGGSPQGGCREGGAASAAALVPAFVALTFFLLLTTECAPTERLELLLQALLPHRYAAERQAAQVAAVAQAAQAAAAPVVTPPLTYAEQRHVYAELWAAAEASVGAARRLAAMLTDAPPTSMPPSHSMVEMLSDDAAASTAVGTRRWQREMGAALDQRPLSWAVRPPGAREFAIWCATREPDTTGAAVVGMTEAEPEPEPAADGGGVGGGASAAAGALPQSARGEGTSSSASAVESSEGASSEGGGSARADVAAHSPLGGWLAGSLIARALGLT